MKLVENETYKLCLTTVEPEPENIEPNIIYIFNDFYYFRNQIGWVQTGKLPKNLRFKNKNDKNNNNKDDQIHRQKVLAYFSGLCDVFESRCMNFTNNVINLIRSKKEKNEDNVDGDSKKGKNKDKVDVDIKDQDSEKVQYFLDIDNVNNFLSHFPKNVRMYIGLSVDQKYHKGMHAVAQVDCVKNLVEAIEKFLQDKLENVTIHGSKITLVFDLVLDFIVADSLQIFKSLPKEGVDSDLSSKQCINMIIEYSKTTTEYEKELIKKGEVIEKHYRELLSQEFQKHQTNVKINLTQEAGTYRWSDLKKEYEDPIFQEMVNYLEACFKFGFERLKLKLDDYEDIKVNHLAYFFCEIVMVNYKIFRDKKIADDAEVAFLLYPGPGEMILKCGKDMLAILFNNRVKNTCFELRSIGLATSEENGKRSKQFFSNSREVDQCMARLNHIKDKLKQDIFNRLIHAELSTSFKDRNTQYFPHFTGSQLRSPGCVSILRVDKFSNSVAIEKAALELLVYMQKCEKTQVTYDIDYKRQLLSKMATLLNRDENAKNEKDARWNYKNQKLINRAGSESPPGRLNFRTMFAYVDLDDAIYDRQLPSEAADHRDFKYYYYSRLVEKFHWDVKHTESVACLWGVAIDTELGFDDKFAVYIYAHLLFNNCSPFTQLANLMRLNYDAYPAFFIGLYILKTNYNDDRMYQCLVQYVSNLFKKSEPGLIDKLFAVFKPKIDNEKPDFAILALECLQYVALCYYSGIEVRLEATLMLSRYEMGIHDILLPIPKKSCTRLIEFDKHHKTRGYRIYIINQLLEFQKIDKYKEDHWIKVTLAYFFAAWSLDNATQIDIEIIERSYRYFLRAYNLLLKLPDFFIQHEFILFLRAESRNFADKLMSPLDRAPRLIEIAIGLYRISACLGCFRSHLALTEFNDGDIKCHYERAIELALVNLDQISAFTTLEKYRKLGLKPAEDKSSEYEQRIHNLRDNLDSLETYQKFKNQSALASLSGIFGNNHHLRYLENISDESPLAIALLVKHTGPRKWRETLVNELKRRNLFDCSVSDYPKKLIFFLTDYYFLAVKCESAIIFFESLRDSLNDIDDENINNKEEIIILTDFYINLIKNKCEECEQSIAKSSLFQQFCKIAFLAVYDSMGIQPEMFLRLRNVFAKRDSDARAYSPGDDVIDYGY